MVHFILYVRDQAASTEFYRILLDQAPRLDVPGMTEFELGSGAVLGLMPESGIERLLGIQTQPATPRCELYLLLEDLEPPLERALQAGARLLSSPSRRNWGDRVVYLSDPDQHVIALAEH